jgi:hypothetical protein
MNAKQYDLIVKAFSRRKFLRTGSAVLAASALAGATALRGQERASTQAAEHDHSSSDPGQENKPLLDENPDSNMPPPTDLVSLAEKSRSRTDEFSYSARLVRFAAAGQQ